MIARAVSVVGIIAFMLGIYLLGHAVLGIGWSGTLVIALIVGTLIGVLGMRSEMQKQRRK
jgi:hypothetical protein